MKVYQLIIFVIVNLFLLLIFSNDLESHQPAYKTILQTSIEPDLLFKEFEYPVFPEELFEILEPIGDSIPSETYFNIYLAVSFTSYADEPVRNVNINPLYNVGNSLEKDHHIWDSITTCIKEASKKWKMKQIFWDINEEGIDEETKEIYKDLNEKIENGVKPISPQAGNFYILIFEIRSIHNRYGYPTAIETIIMRSSH